MILARFNSDGTLDTTHGIDGVATADFGERRHCSLFEWRRAYPAGRWQVRGRRDRTPSVPSALRDSTMTPHLPGSSV